MNAPVVSPITAQRRRDAKLRDTLAEIQKLAADSLAGRMPLDEAVHRINMTVQPAVRETLRGPA